MPGEKRSFSYSLTNLANRAETNLWLILTNYQTNNSCGAWTFELYSAGVLAASTNSGFAEWSAFRTRLPDSIPPGSVLPYRLDVTASAAPDPDCSLSLQLIARVGTNAAGYNVAGVQYGGRTNIVHLVQASAALPIVTLTKSVLFLTNRRFGGYGLTPGCEITYRLWFSNSGNGAGRHLKIVDILPGRYVDIETLDPTNLSGFATNLGRTYSALASGGSWSTLAAGSWNSNLRRVQFFATNALIPPGGTGEVHYKVRIR